MDKIKAILKAIKKKFKSIEYETKVNVLFLTVLYLSVIIFQNTIYFAIILILHLAALIFALIIRLNNNRYASMSKLYYIHHFGAKRRGKDLSFQLSVVKRFRKKYIKHKNKNASGHEPIFYLSNVDYGYGCKLIDLNDLKLKDLKTGKLLNYNDIITGAYKGMKFEKNHEYEGLDLYISDAQLGLPNTEHNALDKQYPWLPPFIALAGQLYNMNIHVNTQEYVRLWVKLRGQQDMYARSLKTFPMNKSGLQKIWPSIPILNRYIFFKVRTYDNASSAEANILPYNAVALVNETLKHGYLTSGQSIKEQYQATHGEIKEFTMALKRKHIKYDSRIFHQYMFGYKYED